MDASKERTRVRGQVFNPHPYKAGGPFLPLVEPVAASLPLVGRAVYISTSPIHCERRNGAKAGEPCGEVKDGAVSIVSGSMQELQRSSAVLSLAVKEGVKRVVGECGEEVEKLTHKFKT
ncbi:hypothetical protein Tco_1570282 [Tanacetum coccineum]